MSTTRAWITERQRRTDRELLEAYRTARAGILASVDELLAVRATGSELSRAQLMRERRLGRLLEDVEQRIAHFADQAEVVILRAQGDAVASAATNTLDAIATKLPPGLGFTPSFPDAPFSELVGRLSSGRPLATLLSTLGPQAARDVRDTLLRGVALGRNPRAIARELSRVTAMPAARALVIARTEVIGSFREAGRRTMAANRDVVGAWQWEAALGARCCAACIAQHGSIHPVDEPMATHPSCRCAMTPVTKSWAELGFADVPETRITPRSGEDWFAEQGPAFQLAALGPAKHAAYASGRIALADLVQPTHSRVWGAGSREASLASALARAQARTARRVAA